MHQFRRDFILQWYPLSPSTKNKRADCSVELSHEHAAHAPARHGGVPRHHRRLRVEKNFVSVVSEPRRHWWWTWFPRRGRISSPPRWPPCLLHMCEMLARTSITQAFFGTVAERFFPHGASLQTFGLKSRERTAGCSIPHPGPHLLLAPSGGDVKDSGSIKSWHICGPFSFFWRSSRRPRGPLLT